VGFEVDLVRALAARAGFDVRYERALWTKVVQQLIDGTVDMICSAATITAERRRLVAFSRPYLSFQLAIVVRREERDVRRLADLAGRVIGVRLATQAEQCVRKALPRETVRAFHFNTDTYAALKVRDVDAVVDDHPIAAGFTGLMPALRVAAAIPRTDSRYGIMFGKENRALRMAVNAALRDLERDGTHAALTRRWFPHAAARRRTGW
jgi:ABC-type amino acid transport substrate-binding protein